MEPPAVDTKRVTSSAPRVPGTRSNKTLAQRWSERLELFSRQMLQVDLVRLGVAWTRYAYYVKLKKQLRTFDSDSPAIGVNTIFHNLRGLKDLAGRRSNRVILPLTIIETLPSDPEILSIGPRTEGELLNFVAHGFSPKSVRGLDLISYSPWIDLGDMHAMPYVDNSFDVVTLAGVLNYSNDRPRVAREIVRVLRPGGLVSMWVDYNPRSAAELSKLVGYKLPDEERMNSPEEILSLFGDHVDTIYFSHGIAPSRREEIGSIILCFSVKKS